MSRNPLLTLQSALAALGVLVLLGALILHLAPRLRGGLVRPVLFRDALDEDLRELNAAIEALPGDTQASVRRGLFAAQVARANTSHPTTREQARSLVAELTHVVRAGGEPSRIDARIAELLQAIDEENE